MKRNAPIHWSAHVSCAIAGVIALALLIVSDVMHVEALGRWGLLSGLLAAVMAAAIVADRCARKLATEAEERAAAVLAEAEAMVARHANAVMKTYEDQTEQIAHAVCDAVMDVFDNRRGAEVRRIGR